MDTLCKTLDARGYFVTAASKHGCSVKVVGESSEVPGALTDYVRGRKGYDYSHHGKADNPSVEFVSDEIVDRFCLVGGAGDHLKRLTELAALGVNQFALYLMHDGAAETFEAYRQTVVPAAAGL